MPRGESPLSPLEGTIAALVGLLKERAIRGMVIARKVWGGNRTWEGARTQQILVSVLRTCWQQGKGAFTRCVGLLRASRGVILDIVPGAG